MKKTVDLAELEEKYGVEFAEEIKGDIDYTSRKNYEWKLEVIYEDQYFITYALVMEFTSIVYEVSKKRKVINEQYVIGQTICEKLLNLMKGFEQKEKAVKLCQAHCANSASELISQI